MYKVLCAAHTSLFLICSFVILFFSLFICQPCESKCYIANLGLRFNRYQYLKAAFCIEVYCIENVVGRVNVSTKNRDERFIYRVLFSAQRLFKQVQMIIENKHVTKIYNTQH